MADRQTGRSFLGEAASRLAAFLNVEGLLSPRFPPDPQLIPTIRLGDVSGPGFNVVGGRFFAWANQTSAAGRVGIRATAGPGIVLTGMTVDIRVATGRVWARAMDPTTATAIWPGLTVANVTSTERKGSTGGEVPASAGIAAPGGVAAPADTQIVMDLAAGLGMQFVPLNVFLQPPTSALGGGAFEVGAVAATSELDVSFFGYVFTGG